MKQTLTIVKSHVARACCSCLAVLLFILLTFANAGIVNAQKSTESRATGQTPAAVTTETPGPAISNGTNSSSFEVQTVKKDRLPHENYLGIQDPEKAKEVWIRDHPEEYKAMLESTNPAEKSALTPKPSATEKNQ